MPKNCAHPVTVILDVLPLRIWWDAVIGAWNKTPQLNDRTQSFHFSIDGGIISGKNHFIHTTHAAYFFSILFSPGGQAGVPGSNLDGEHGIDTVLDPGGD